MFEELFTLPSTVERYRTALLAEYRLRYLRHLQETGARRQTLLKSANDQLSVVRLLDLREGDRVSVSQAEAATTNWSRPGGRRCYRPASPKARTWFVSHAVRWLRSPGWLGEPESMQHPYSAEVAAYEAWMRGERGLSEATIRDYCVAADQLFDWLAAGDVLLASVRITDIDGAIAAQDARGNWSRRPTHDYAQRLRIAAAPL